MTDRGEAALLWLALDHHPDEQVRAVLGELLRPLSADPRDGQFAIDALELVRNERGTAIEPFVLDGGDAERAIDLLRLASATSGRQGVQVVSRDKLEPQGGQLITRSEDDESIQATYLERLATRGSMPQDAERAWRFSPGHAPRHADLIASLGRVLAKVTVDDTGVHTMAGPFTPESTLSRIQPYRAGSIAISGEDLSSIGGNLDVIRLSGEAWLAVTANTPERQIRLSGAMAARTWVLIDVSVAGTGMAVLGIRLDAPDEDRDVDLHVIRILGEPVISRLETWIRTPEETRLSTVPPATARAIGEWLGIVPSWLTADLLQEYA